MKISKLSRNDEFEGAVGTAMDIGATVLKVGFTKVGNCLANVKTLGQNALAMGALASLTINSKMPSQMDVALWCYKWDGMGWGEL